MHSRGYFQHVLYDLRPVERVNYPAGVAIVGAYAGGCIWDINGMLR